MYALIKKILFVLPAETAHHFTTKGLRLICKIPGFSILLSSLFRVSDKRLEKTVFGLKFPNPIGLAAGFDKNADFLKEFKNFGFGFIEIGTITPLAQPGNPKPRLFRLPKDGALINRMGFNNYGMQQAVQRLQNRPKNLIVGGNIGKNKVTPNDQAVDDYIKCFHTLFDLVDYFVVNVSSPNTPDLRQLQEKEPLTQLLKALDLENQKKSVQKPILLKIAPDLTESQLDDILDIVVETACAGIIATNTTISRENLSTSDNQIDSIGAGGLSGAPLRDRSTEVIKYLRKGNATVPIIGVGGIYDEDSALEKLRAGADLIQLYSGFIYQGPTLIKRINRAILNYIDEG